MVANPARGQLNRKMIFSLSPFAREKLVSRDGFGRPAMSARSISTLGLNLVMAHSRDFSRFPRWRPFIYIVRASSPQGSSNNVY